MIRLGSDPFYTILDIKGSDKTSEPFFFMKIRVVCPQSYHLRLKRFPFQK